MIQKLEMVQNMSQRLQLKLIGKIKVAEFLSIPESDFESYIKEVEENPLFIALKEKYRIISYRKFYDVKNSRVPQLKEETLPDQNEVEMENLLSDPSIFDLVRRIGKIIGEKSFREVLIGEISINQVIKRCSLSLSEAKIFREFVDKFQLQQIINPSFSFTPSRYSRFFLIASFEWEKNELVIRPLKEENYLIKGKYQVNYRKFQELVDTGKIKHSQMNKVMEIFKQLDMINRRITTIYRVLHHLKEIQRSFFKSGNPLDLLPFSQSELARCLNLSPSTVNRAIANKSILTPQGEERPIKFFFSRRWAKNLIKKIILEEKKKIQEGSLSFPLTDELIRKRIIEVYRISLSRRSVSKYRKVLKIPSSHQRYK